MNQHLPVSESDRALAPISAPSVLGLGVTPAKASYEAPQLIAYGHLCNLTLQDPTSAGNTDGTGV